MAQIGIRLADGRFYPILEESDEVKKRLVLTTVKDGQTSVQIDVYRGAEDPLVERSYVGSLVIENIPARPKGEPDIRLDIGLDAEGNLSAFAKELVSGEHQALSVSLKSLSHEETYDIPDFDFQEESGASADDFDIPEDDAFASPDDNPFEPEPEPEPEPEGKAPALTFIDDGYAEKPEESEEKVAERRGSRVLPWLLALAIIVAALAVAFLVFRCTADRQPAPPVASAPVSQAAPEPAPAPAAPPATQAATPPAPTPAPAPAPPPAAAPAPAPTQPAAQPAKQGGVNHKIRWGDTLWDISIAYYRTPWLYGTIARANNIKNPDLIISGTTIYIPPR